jgi:colanic acid/amylovoran biosynthesis protein
MGVDTPIKVTADSAFSLPNPMNIPKYRQTIDNSVGNKYNWINLNKLNVGISVRNWSISNTQRKQYINSILNLIKHILNKYDATITFWPQVLEDIPLSKMIYELLPEDYRRNCFVVSDDLDPLVLKGLYGYVDIFVGTRMHSTIFAMTMNVPTISIAYMPKSQDLMHRLKLEDLLFNIGSIEGDSLIETFEYTLNNNDFIKLKLKKEMNYMHELALLNAEYAYKLVKEGDL